MTRKLAALAVILVLAACGGSGDGEPAAKTTRSVQPIGDAQLQVVVNALCLDDTYKTLEVLGNVSRTDHARYERVLRAMYATCPLTTAGLDDIAGGL